MITLQQATSNSGTNAKALTFTRIRTKIGAIAATPQWAVVSQTAANTATPVSAASPALIVVEVQPTDLDLANGFGYVQLSIPDTGSNAQLGTGFYIAYGLRFAQNVPPSALS